MYEILNQINKLKLAYSKIYHISSMYFLKKMALACQQCSKNKPNYNEHRDERLNPIRWPCFATVSILKYLTMVGFSE